MKITKLLEARSDLEVSPNDKELDSRIRSSKTIKWERMKKFEQHLEKLVNAGKVKRMGVGLSGVVYDMPNKVNTVLKKGRHPIDMYTLDDYVRFVDAVMKKAPTNPYLPRIESLSFYMVDTGDEYTTFNFSDDEDEDDGDVDAFPESEYFQYAVKMEKLYSARQMNREFYKGAGGLEIFAVDKREGEQGPDSQFGVLYKKLTGHDLEGKRENALRELVNLVRRAIDGRVEGIKDKKFLEAAALIRQVAGETAIIDISSANIMFRRLPYGLELVITDPLM